jgi:Protein of unknown function (DUF2442)
MIKITSIRTAPPYRLQIQFSDGAFGVFDFAAVLDEPGTVRELRDRKLFSSVRLEYGVPTWPNHFDVSPGWLREEMEKRGTLQLPTPPRKR